MRGGEKIMIFEDKNGDIDYKKVVKTVGLGFLALFLLIEFFSMFVQVPAGSVGVKTRFGAVVGVLQPGMNVKLPELFESVTIMNSRILKADVKAEAGSSDLQTVKTDIVVNYHIDAKKAQDIFQKIGDNVVVEETILRPAVSEVVKASVAKKTAENVLKQRPALKQDIDKELASRMKKYNVFIDDVSVTNVDFSAEYNAAIEAKQVAEQQVKTAQFIADKAQKDAEAAINKAQGEAQAQRLQQQTLTPEILQKMWIQQWNGILPVYMIGGDTSTLLQLPTVQK